MRQSCRSHMLIMRKTLLRRANAIHTLKQRLECSINRPSSQKSLEARYAARPAWPCACWPPDDPALGREDALGRPSIMRMQYAFSSLNCRSSSRSSRKLGKNLSRRSRFMIRMRLTSSLLSGLATKILKMWKAS